MIFLGGSLCLLYIGLVLEKRKKETLKIMYIYHIC
jgi:hypothetical protein